VPHGHRIAELRSLEYHRLIAERVKRDPEVLRRARERVACWLAEGGPVDRGRALRWQHVLHLPVPELVRVLTRDDETGRDLRQNTPFAGVLTNEERWRVIRETGREKEPSTSGGGTSST
jgi:hypothetical protein